MGIDFSHGDAHWSYGGFHRFRILIAENCNINLSEMEGFGGTKSWENIDDPIVPFLYHSDCDGKLSPKECKMIIPRLRELIKMIPEEDQYQYDITMGLELVEGMTLASSCNEDLIFC
ncbi:MAG: hypothetical protein ACOCZ5_01340 [bacterium]